MNHSVLPRRTWLYFSMATLAALLMALLVNLTFIVRYQPLFEATAGASLRSYLPLVSTDGSSTSAQSDAMRQAVAVAATKLDELQLLLTSEQAVQHAEDACRAANLAVGDFSIDEFAKRVKVFRVGLDYTISFRDETPENAAAVANGLTAYAEKQLGGGDYRNSQAYFDQIVAERTRQQAEALRLTADLKRIYDRLKATNAQAAQAQTFKKEDFESMATLANSIIKANSERAVALTQIQALEELQKAQSDAFDESVLAQLKTRAEQLRLSVTTTNSEIEELWRRLVPDDEDYFRIQRATLDKSMAGAAAQQLDEREQEMRKMFYLRRTAQADPPTSPVIGRPLLPMLLLTALAIAVPYGLSFLLVLQSAAQAQSE